MSDNKIVKENDMEKLFGNIKTLIKQSRSRVYRTVNTEMLFLYWSIGKMVVERQGGTRRAKYGDYLIEKVAERLKDEFGSGFSARNLRAMRRLYICYPIWQTPSAKFMERGQIGLTPPPQSKGTHLIHATLSTELSWSHYIELIKIKDEKKRNFYTMECINSGWSVRELQRQKSTFLYERLLSGKSKSRIDKLSQKGQEILQNEDIIKDPFVLEFLDIEKVADYHETELEKSILNHLKEFLLELGKGFSFVGNQVRIAMDTEHYYPDLVFYNRILKCFVIIDLKLGKVTHKDIGQMQMYVNYYDREVKSSNENKTIGILLSTDKNETLVRYTLPEENDTIFSSEFSLTIPSEDQFIDIVEQGKLNSELK